MCSPAVMPPHRCAGELRAGSPVGRDSFFRARCLILQESVEVPVGQPRGPGLAPWLTRGADMVFCRYCSQRVEIDHSVQKAGVAWCPHCRKVFDLPLYKVPGWIAGTLCFLLIQAYFGL